jgi:hypothetical protein
MPRLKSGPIRSKGKSTAQGEKEDQAEKDEPQPQLLVELGLM